MPRVVEIALGEANRPVDPRIWGEKSLKSIIDARDERIELRNRFGSTRNTIALKTRLRIKLDRTTIDA